MGARRVSPGEVYQFINPNPKAASDGFYITMSPTPIFARRNWGGIRATTGDVITILDVLKSPDGHRQTFKVALHRDMGIYYCYFVRNNRCKRIVRCKKETSSSSPENTPSPLP